MAESCNSAPTSCTQHRKAIHISNDAQSPSRPKFVRKRIFIAIFVFLIACGAYFLARVVESGFAARSGREDLNRAAAALRAQHLPEARALLVAARDHFRSAHAYLHATGPLLPIAHVIPLVRIQVRGLETMTGVGGLLAGAGLDVVDAAQGGLDAKNANQPLASSMNRFRTMESTLRSATDTLATARAQTARLDGYRLFGPLSSMRDKLESELADAEHRAVKADAGLRVLLWVAGADRPTRLLVFSQNPDELRPTGGFMGTYGVMTGDGGHVRLPAYGDINRWVRAHPGVGIPAARAPSAFQFSTPPAPQTLANTNASPDWPTAARLATKIWADGGEPAVDGVVSLLPPELARLVRVLGTVRMPKYGETITGDNLIARLNYHTHREAVRNDPGRKQFVADLARDVLRRTLAAPSSQWLALGKAMAAGFDAGEATLWSADPAQQRLLDSVGWAGRFPATNGDFFADAEFEYLAKNGGALHRTFTHVATLNADGSGLSSTTMVLTDTAPPEPVYNDDSLSYLTPYGPRFSTLAPSSDKPDALEPSLAGHPTAGYLRAAQPRGSMTLHVAWRSQLLAQPRTDGSLLYTLEFRGQPGHTGDMLHLLVHPPPGWHWVRPPPTVIRVAGVFRGAWVLERK